MEILTRVVTVSEETFACHAAVGTWCTDATGLCQPTSIAVTGRMAINKSSVVTHKHLYMEMKAFLPCDLFPLHFV